jgi:hypothetical protein
MAASRDYLLGAGRDQTSHGLRNGLPRMRAGSRECFSEASGIFNSYHGIAFMLEALSA